MARRPGEPRHPRALPPLPPTRSWVLRSSGLSWPGPPGRRSRRAPPHRPRFRARQRARYPAGLGATRTDAGCRGPGRRRDAGPLRSWSWRESNPRPSSGHRSRYDRSRARGSSATTSPGRVDGGLTAPSLPPELSPGSAVFAAVSGLSRRRPPLLLPGCGGSAPRAIAGRWFPTSPEDQAARAKSRLAFLFVAPFNESEQLGPHVRLPVPTSKPISPVMMITVAPDRRPGRHRVAPLGTPGGRRGDAGLVLRCTGRGRSQRLPGCALSRISPPCCDPPGVGPSVAASPLVIVGPRPG